MSGIVSGAWGLSPREIAGMDNIVQNSNGVPLTYNESLNSVVPKFNPDGTYVSPLTVANNSYYSSSFGKKYKKISLKYILKDIAFLRKV
jgi:hypothetical protein